MENEIFHPDSSTSVPPPLQSEQRIGFRSGEETRKQFEIKRRKDAAGGREEEKKKRRRRKKEEEEMTNLLKELEGGSQLLFGGDHSLLPFNEMHYSTYSRQDSQRRRRKNPKEQQPKNKETQRTSSRQRDDAKERARRILGSERPRVDPSARLVAACLDEEEPFEEEPFEQQQHYGQLDFYADEQSLFDAYGLEAIEDVAVATAAISPMRRQNHHHHNSDVIRVPMLEDIQEIISQENSFGQDSQ